MKVARAGEVLADDGGSDDLAVAHDELAIGLRGHYEVSHSCDGEGIDDAHKHRGDQRVAKRNQKHGAKAGVALMPDGAGVQFHAAIIGRRHCSSSAYTRCRPVMARSISLIPMNGTATPPSP